MLNAIPKISVDELFAESVYGPANTIHPENDLQSLLSFLADDCGADIRISEGISLKKIKREVSAAAIAIRSRWGDQMQDQHHVILERIHRGIVIVEDLGSIDKALDLHQKRERAKFFPSEEGAELRELPPKISFDTVGLVVGGYKAILLNGNFFRKSDLGKRRHVLTHEIWHTLSFNNLHHFLDETLTDILTTSTTRANHEVYSSIDYKYFLARKFWDKLSSMVGEKILLNAYLNCSVVEETYDLLTNHAPRIRHIDLPLHELMRKLFSAKGKPSHWDKIFNPMQEGKMIIPWLRFLFS